MGLVDDSGSGVPSVSGLKASGCEWKMGEDVGNEKASWVVDIVWLLPLVFCAALLAKMDVNQPMVRC